MNALSLLAEHPQYRPLMRKGAIFQTMEHSTTKTTDEHYCHIRNDRALDDIERAWESRSSVKQIRKGRWLGMREAVPPCDPDALFGASMREKLQSHQV
jgi:hypothetical protein